MELEITVYRKENGDPCFRYPKDWSYDKVFEQICELCCQLQEKVDRQQEVIRVLRYVANHQCNGGT